MADFFKPRRGTQLKATEVLKGENKLRAGELFFELEYDGNTKTVKSGRIMIGDGISNYTDLVTNDRYIFNPDDYMGVTSKFTPTPSTETTIDANIAKIGSENNIKEKIGATSKALSIIGDNKADKKDIIYATKFEEIPGSRGQGTRITFSNGDTSSYTTHEFDSYGFEYKLGDSKNAATSMYSFKSRNANTATYATKSGTANAVAWNNISGTPSTFTPSTHNHSTAEITNFVANVKTIKVNNASTADYAKFNGFGKSKIYAMTASQSRRLLRAKELISGQGDSFSALIYARDEDGGEKLYLYTKFAGQSTEFPVEAILMAIKEDNTGFFIQLDSDKVYLSSNAVRNIFVHIFVMSGKFELFDQ